MKTDLLTKEDRYLFEWRLNRASAAEKVADICEKFQVRTISPPSSSLSPSL